MKTDDSVKIFNDTIAAYPPMMTRTRIDGINKSKECFLGSEDYESGRINCPCALVP